MEVPRSNLRLRNASGEAGSPDVSAPFGQQLKTLCDTQAVLQSTANRPQPSHQPPPAPHLARQSTRAIATSQPARPHRGPPPCNSHKRLVPARIRDQRSHRTGRHRCRPHGLSSTCSRSCSLASPALPRSLFTPTLSRHPQALLHPSPEGSVGQAHATRLCAQFNGQVSKIKLSLAFSIRD